MKTTIAFRSPAEVKRDRIVAEQEAARRWPFPTPMQVRRLEAEKAIERLRANYITAVDEPLQQAVSTILRRETSCKNCGAPYEPECSYCGTKPP